MKKLFIMLAVVCGSMSLGSCLNFDEPGDELNQNQMLYQYEDVDDDGAEQQAAPVDTDVNE